MAGFFVFGVPHGEQMSKCNDDTRNFLQTFYKPIEYYIKIGYNIFINNEQVKYKEDTACVIA